MDRRRIFHRTFNGSSKESVRLHLFRRIACQTLSRAFETSSATVYVAPGMLKVLAILSPATVKRSTVKQEAMTPYWKLEKNSIC